MVFRLTIFGCLFFAVVRTKSASAVDVDFSRVVKPLLAEHCLKCHGPDEAEGGLDLSRRDKALLKTESDVFAIVPGQSGESEIIKRISSSDPDLRMPPGDEKPLKDSEIETLKSWIDAGAEYQAHWSFRELSSPTLPPVSNEAWIKNPIDRFVLSKLDQEKIEPSPQAPPHVLVRRLYLDLLGLLPKPEAVDRFITDYARAATPDKVYEELVDELLASPHFGERWGRHWLDLARYADSDGYEKDRPRPDAYVYRDWVIQAFNDNKPFDAFTIEQLAGDLLPNATPAQRIATAFNRQTLTNTEGGTDQEEFRVAATFDRTDTVSSVWLGLTMGCAKCHTHKYDPIPHTDYYRFFAFFNEADECQETLPVDMKCDPAVLAELLPLEQALQQHYRDIFEDEQKWEAEQRELVESGKNEPLKVADNPLRLEATSQAGLQFTTRDDGITVVELPADSERKAIPDTDTYALTLRDLPPALTGLRIDVVPDKLLSKGGSGLTKGGNFVVSRLSAEIVDDAGKIIRTLNLQNAEADFEQASFKAADTLSTKINTKKGWAVSPKVDKPHWIQVRTAHPLTLKPHERVRLNIEQAYGTQHLIGRFQVRAVTGDARDLHLNKAIINALKMYPEKRTNDTKELLFNFYVQQDPKARKLLAEIEAVHKKAKLKVMPVRTIAYTKYDRKTHRFDRGDFLSPAEEVRPGTPSALPELTSPAEKATRLDLAQWLVGPQNPLTPRVIANQFWSRLFGAGIVRSVGDFGVRGEIPSHPELLDWLAVTYRDDLKWNTKAYLKTVLLSNTYRQASTHRPELVQRDPLNQWLSRQNRIRVEAELVRDLSLQVAGLLSPKLGGPSVFPPMPPELAKLSYANNFSWTDSKGEDRYRRGLYTFFKRTLPHPTLMTFDCPDANLTCVNRSVSNTPLQALALLNNESFVEASQSLAKMLLSRSGESDEQRIDFAFRTCLTRAPTKAEQEQLESLLDHARQYYGASVEHMEDAEAIAADYTVPGVSSVETAAWIATVRVLINLDEFITRE